MKKCFFVFLLFMGLLSAMAQEQSTNMKEVMAMHDEVMEKMPELVKMINKLQTVSQEASDKAPYELAIEDLKAANKSMQDWMVGFGGRFDADEMMKGKALNEEKKKWLQEERAKVMVVDEEIDASLEKAQSLLGKE